MVAPILSGLQLLMPASLLWPSLPPLGTTLLSFRNSQLTTSDLFAQLPCIVNSFCQTQPSLLFLLQTSLVCCCCAISASLLYLCSAISTFCLLQ
ncbi:hypothetical protein K1719_003493 [Acacia pycnantha]|nr:hypothetical protein K1719_003493 [Acacia pycnantha]